MRQASTGTVGRTMEFSDLLRRLSAGAALIALAVLAGAAALARATPAAAQDKVFVPSFWDPAHRPERPDTGSLRIIRFLTDDDFPPFHFALPDGSLAGFNVELARAVCDELKVACTIQPRRWDTLVDALNEARGDAAIASLAITDAMRRRVDFTAPYYRTPARFAARKGVFSGADLGALSGKTVGVEARSAHEAFLKAFFAGVTIKPYESAVGLRAALRSGDVTAIFGDGIALALWLNGSDSGGCCAFFAGPFTESRYFGSGVGIAVRRNNAALRQALDYALQRLAERGVYAELYLKYFPVGFY